MRGSSPQGRAPRCHLWGFDAAVGDAGTGALKSDTFTLGGDGQIDLLTTCGHDPDNLYAAVVREPDRTVLGKGSGMTHASVASFAARRAATIGGQSGVLLFLRHLHAQTRPHAPPATPIAPELYLTADV